MYDIMMSWEVESRKNSKGQWRYRYQCNRCGVTGPWRVNPNDADGDNHLYSKHGIGE